MERVLIFFGTLIAGISFYLWSTSQVTSSTKIQKETAAIKTLLVQYKKSINDADTTLGSKIWAHTNEVSFIHPRGHEHGWEGVKNNVYGMFRNAFSARDLKSDNETINVYGDVAWVEFYWVFDATFAGEKPMPLQTKGRETQILKKIKNEWRIEHIHYSGLPVTEQQKGF